MDGPLLTKSEHTIQGDSSSKAEEHIVNVAINEEYSSTPQLGKWCLIEFVLNLVQIIAAIVVLTEAKHEHEKTIVVVWIIGYTSGCFAILLIHFINSVFSRMYFWKEVLECFFVFWAMLLLWIYHDSSLSSLYNNTQHFWLCLSLLAFTCIRYVPSKLEFLTFCLIVFEMICVVKERITNKGRITLHVWVELMLLSVIVTILILCHTVCKT